MADEQNQGPQVTEVGGTQVVQMEGNPQGQAQIEGDKTNQVQPQAARPEGLPEGFDSWEAFGKAQLEAQQKAKEEAEADTNALTEEQQGQVTSELEKFPEEAREKARPFVEEAARTGTLSQESKEAAAKAFGVPVDWVESYLRGATEQAQTDVVSPIMEQIGGQETWQGFQEWAEANYTAEQKAAFNRGLEADPTKTVTEAVKTWREAGNGPAPRDITRGERGQVPGGEQVQGYASQAEMQRDMANPLYAKDPAFRAKVEARVGRSDFNLSRSV